MNGYGLEMMPIVGFYGPVITAVLVHWFLPKISLFRTFSTLEIVIQIGSQPNLAWGMEWGWGPTLFNDVMMTSSPTSRFVDYGPKTFTFSYIFHTGDRNSSWISTKLGMNDGVWSGTNPIQWRHDDVITDVTVRWLRTKNLVYLCLPPFLTPLEWR